MEETGVGNREKRGKEETEVGREKKEETGGRKEWRERRKYPKAFFRGRTECRLPWQDSVLFCRKIDELCPSRTTKRDKRKGGSAGRSARLDADIRWLESNKRAFWNEWGNQQPPPTSALSPRDGLHSYTRTSVFMMATFVYLTRKHRYDVPSAQFGHLYFSGGDENGPFARNFTIFRDHFEQVLVACR